MQTHGADPENWPQEERAELVAYLEAEPGAQLGLEEAKALDDALGLVNDVPLPSTLKADLMAEAHATLVGKSVNDARPESGLLSWMLNVGSQFAALARPPAVAGLLASVLVIGVWFGASISVEPLEDDEVLTAFGEDYWDDDEDLFDLPGETL